MIHFINQYFIKSGITFLLITSFIFFSNPLVSQYYPPSFYSSSDIDSSMENTLVLNIDNSNFLKNNEYFNDMVDGYTLIGYHISPKLVYYPFKKAKIEMGVHFLKYSGIDKFTKVIPSLSFQYNAGKSAKIIIGTLQGATNHQMIEPLFNYENYFTDKIENGLQFLFDTKIYQGDIWINWQQFIFKGDEKQEIFTVGLSNRFYLNNKSNISSFSVPLQAIFVHHGGQINSTSEAVTTLNNSAIGLNYSFRPEGRFFKSVSLEQLFVAYNDLSTEHQWPYIQGYGIYSQAIVKAWFFYFRLAHWYGDFFITGQGDPIFQSVSTINTAHKEAQRAMITSRLLFEKNIVKGLNIGAGFETYSDLYNYTMDYWYMFYINFNRDFFIKKFK